MGCSQSTLVEEVRGMHPAVPEKSSAPNGEEAAGAIKRNVLTIGDSIHAECPDPIPFEDFDSFHHLQDSMDEKISRAGHRLPVDRMTHLRAAMETRASIQELVADPSRLKRAVKLCRASKPGASKGFGAPRARSLLE